MQLPIQSQSRIYAEPWEEGTGAAELARGRRRLRGRRAVLRGRVRPRGRARGAGPADADHLVRHRRHAGVDRRSHRAPPAAVPRVRPRLPAPPGVGQGLPHPRRALGRPDHPRGRHRPRGGRVRGAGRRLRQPGVGDRRVHRRPEGRLHRRVPDVRRRALHGGGGRAATPPPPGGPAHLGRWLVQARPAPGRGAGRRLAAAGDAPPRAGRRHRLPARAPQGDPGRRSHRPRHHLRADLRGRAGLGRRSVDDQRRRPTRSPRRSGPSRTSA